MPINFINFASKNHMCFKSHSRFLKDGCVWKWGIAGIAPNKDQHFLVKCDLPSWLSPKLPAEIWDLIGYDHRYVLFFGGDGVHSRWVFWGDPDRPWLMAWLRTRGFKTMPRRAMGSGWTTAGAACSLAPGGWVVGRFCWFLLVFLTRKMPICEPWGWNIYQYLHHGPVM